MLEPARPSLHRTYDAVPETVPVVRHELTALAADLGAASGVLDALRLAVSEAVTNAVLHAYPDGGPGTVSVTAGQAGDELWVLIADEGCGPQTQSRSPGLGWGLALIAQAADGFVVAERAGGGTEVRMRFQIESPPDRRGGLGARGGEHASQGCAPRAVAPAGHSLARRGFPSSR